MEHEETSLEQPPDGLASPGEAAQPDAAELPEPEQDEAQQDTPAGGDLFDPAAFTRSEKRALFTAVLFAAGDMLPAARLGEFFGLDEAELAVLADEAAAELRPRGLDILSAAGGYRLVTAGEWDEPLRRFHRQVRKAKLSRGALEILAIIAYEQPMSRARIDELRQVNSESTVRTLLDRRLITVAGRAETPGRPFLYRTTEHFLEVFGLNTLDDLPPRPAALDLPPAQRDGPFSIDSLPDFSADELED